ncbi:MAG: hypothetical protein HXM87_06490 [Neisseria sp.]|jgi:hypothetical protein|uniref:hypothetical protein n=1 Tax=unclassified Neisseria TaxID=2623750 RepID=UPI001CAF379D|nr:hypothetical protein [Neisseria sp.]MBF1278063.1 hypothetical protein [Neisseria sp.]DAS85281.1 MAG TPA: hypothetical protein [Caudoviricetes sp.]
MTIYLNIARDGIIKVTQDTALGNQEGDTDYLSKELNEGCTLEEVYAVVAANTSWRNGLFYFPPVDVEDGDQACDAAIDFSDLVYCSLKRLMEART